jgi:hypothetical protein
MDGLGALIITPTRELAFQIFETLRKVGQYHDFSAGLIIGKFHCKGYMYCQVGTFIPVKRGSKVLL